VHPQFTHRHVLARAIIYEKQLKFLCQLTIHGTCIESISGHHHDNYGRHLFDNYENIP